MASLFLSRKNEWDFSFKCSITQLLWNGYPGMNQPDTTIKTGTDQECLQSKKGVSAPRRPSVQPSISWTWQFNDYMFLGLHFFYAQQYFSHKCLLLIQCSWETVYCCLSAALLFYFRSMLSPRVNADVMAEKTASLCFFVLGVPSYFFMKVFCCDNGHWLVEAMKTKNNFCGLLSPSKTMAILTQLPSAVFSLVSYQVTGPYSYQVLIMWPTEVTLEETTAQLQWCLQFCLASPLEC